MQKDHLAKFNINSLKKNTLWNTGEFPHLDKDITANVILNGGRLNAFL